MVLVSLAPLVEGKVTDGGEAQVLVQLVQGQSRAPPCLQGDHVHLTVDDLEQTSFF